jgi:non-specific serine/threonine protein kinase
VIADLPEKTELTAYCGLTRRQAALYAQTVEALERDLRTKRDDQARRGLVLAYLLRLKQVCNHPSQWLGDGAYDPADSGKLVRLGELAAELAARQEKVLVFTQFREVTAPLARFLAGAFGREGLVLTGETKLKERRALVERFQDEQGPPFFVLSLKAGGTGLNLTAASHVVHFDRWWNPAVEDQATDRAFRIGQRRSVLVHKFVVRGTVEERIDALIEGKRALAGEVVEGGGEVALTELSDEELLRVVALDVRAALAEG